MTRLWNGAQEALEVWARMNPYEIFHRGFGCLAALQSGEFRVGE
jgi:hypothetical protein